MATAQGCHTKSINLKKLTWLKAVLTPDVFVIMHVIFMARERIRYKSKAGELNQSLIRLPLATYTAAH